MYRSLAEEFKQACDSAGVSQAEAIQRLMREFIANQKRELMIRVMSVPNRSTFCIGCSQFFATLDIEKARIQAISAQIRAFI